MIGAAWLQQSRLSRGRDDRHHLEEELCAEIGRRLADVVQWRDLDQVAADDAVGNRRHRSQRFDRLEAVWTKWFWAAHAGRTCRIDEIDVEGDVDLMTFKAVEPRRKRGADVGAHGL